MKKRILIYILFVLALTLVSCFSLVEMDGIWGYGFSYNIASGMIPYKDFNMVIGPFYSIIFSFFIKIFGNYFLAYSFQHAVIYGIVFLFMYEMIGKKSIYVLLLLGCALTSFGYNTFCSILVIAILLLLGSKIKYKQVYIGIIIGIILMTKHNIGLILSLIYLFDNRKNFKQVFSLLIPIIPTFIYLLFNNILYDYIDFCYLGMGNFLDNLYIDIMSLPIAIYMLYFLIKKYVINTDTKILYIIGFQIILFPILDQGHIIPAMIPFTYYCLTLDVNKKLQFLLKYFIIIGAISTLIIPNISTRISFKNNFLFLQRIRGEWEIYLEKYSSYLDSIDNKNVYLFLDNAYLIKIFRNNNPSFYDLYNQGNYGSDEYKYVKLLDKNCKSQQCMFVLDKLYFKMRYGDQRSLLFKNYVLSNSVYLETLPSGDRVYINY